MKKTAAILLSALLCFNWYGYQFVAGYLQYQAGLQLEARLDNNDYNDSQLIKVRIPLNLPYHNDWNYYERYDGEIEFRGIHYKYVKRTIENGDLVLLCLPNNAKQHIQSAKEEFFKLVNDLQQETTGKTTNPGKASALKNFFSDYHQEKNSWEITALQAGSTEFNDTKFYFPSVVNRLKPEQPPEYLC